MYFYDVKCRPFQVFKDVLLGKWMGAIPYWDWLDVLGDWRKGNDEQ